MSEIDRAGAGFVATGVVGDMNVENAVDAAGQNIFRALVHDGGMIDVVDDADFRTGDVIDDIQPLAGGIEEIADVVDADIERLDTEAHAAVHQGCRRRPAACR